MQLLTNIDVPPMMIGLVLIHFKKRFDPYFQLPANIVRFHRPATSLKCFDTDGELNVSEALKAVFTEGHNLMCNINMRDNVVSKLKEFGISKEIKSRILSDIFGATKQSTKTKGLIDCFNSDEVDKRFQQLKPKCKQLHQKGEAFAMYFQTHKLPFVKNIMTARIHTAAGLGFPPEVYTQNANDSINNMIKSQCKEKKLILREATLGIQACVHERQTQVNLATLGVGEFKAAERYRRYAVQRDEYYAMNQQQRQRKKNDFNSVETSIHLLKISHPSAGRKQRKDDLLRGLYLRQKPFFKIIKINDKDAPWITPELKSAIRCKHRLFRKYVRRGRSHEDWKTVKEIQAENSKKILNAKDSYYLKLGKKLSDPCIGIKEYWSVLNRMIQKKKFSNIPPLLENGLFVTNIDTKANIFNEYFVKQCCAITTGSTLPSFLLRSAPRLQSLEIDKEKVLRIIRALDSTKAHGCDDISISMIKMCDTSIVEPLCLIFEKCLETGVYPSIWKKANVIPVHKKNSRQSKENYRPISLLPIFGKIFEKLIFDSMYEHFCNHGLITPNQSGFRPNDYAINQLLAITHHVYCTFEENPSKETRAVFLDLSKAFDRVWHGGLIYKLECKGISGNLLTLVRNYLKDHMQRVVLNGRSSEWATVSAGVPQGLVLGPVFFLIYINDLTENVACGVRLFADDTSLFSVVQSENETAQALNSDLEKLRIWAWQWKMKLNADKTEEFVFSCKRNKLVHPTLKLGSSDISAKIEHKHLGMILDSKLDFQSHVREAIVKARRGIGMIRYLSRYVSREVLDVIYKLHVRPHLNYGDMIYHKYDPGMRLTFTQKLEQTQYLAALAVTGTWRGTNRWRLFNELGGDCSNPKTMGIPRRQVNRIPITSYDRIMEESYR